MVHTVQLCQDLTGWYATMREDPPDYPGASVHWAAAFENPLDAIAVLDLAQALAFRLADGGVAWTPGRAPSWG